MHSRALDVHELMVSQPSAMNNSGRTDGGACEGLSAGVRCEGRAAGFGCPAGMRSRCGLPSSTSM